MNMKDFYPHPKQRWLFSTDPAYGKESLVTAFIDEAKPYTRRIKMTEQIKDPLYKDQWNLELMNVPEAWKYSTGKGVVVGIIDSGVDPTHKDLGWDEDVYISSGDGKLIVKQKTAHIYDAIADRKHTKILPGWNFIDDNNFTFDFYRHGTYMAGIIAADRDDVGIVGVAPDCKIRPYVVIDGNGNGNQVDVAKAIDKAIGDECDVISISLAFWNSRFGVQEAINRANNKGVIIVAAAGNNDIERIMYPANYDKVLAIGACNREGLRWRHSDNFGSNYGEGLFCVCPGASQPTTWFYNSRHTNVNATSAATANMAGIAALAKSVDKDIDMIEFHSLVWKGSTWDTQIGWGVPDAGKIVKTLWDRRVEPEHPSSAYIDTALIYARKVVKELEEYNKLTTFS